MTEASTKSTMPSLSGDYVVDATHSRLGFVARHAMVTKVRGQFDSFEGRAHLDFEDPARSEGEVTIDVRSVDTNNEQRDAHLRANDFFDADNHAEITFRSARVEPLGKDRYRLTGDLTIKGSSRPVTLEVEHTGVATDPFGNTRVGLEGTTTVNRKDWGVSWNAALEAGGVLVSEKVNLELDLSLVKAESAS